MKSLLCVLALAMVFTLNVNEASARGKGRKSNEAAKQACLKKDPSLSGKSLKKCIKENRK